MNQQTSLGAPSFIVYHMAIYGHILDMLYEIICCFFLNYGHRIGGNMMLMRIGCRDLGRI